MLLKMRIIVLLITTFIVGCITPVYASELKLSLDDKNLLQQGGAAHFLLEVDSNRIIEDVLENFVEDIRRILRQNRLGYSGLKVVNDRVQVTIISPKQIESALKSIRLNYPAVISQPDDRSTLTIGMETDEKKEIIDAAISSTVIKLRERLSSRLRNDKTSFVQRVGNSNRIVLQYPAGFDPDNLPLLIQGRPPRLTLQAVDERILEDGIVPAGSVALRQLLSFDSGKATDSNSRQVIIKKRVLLGGKNIRGAEMINNKNGIPEIHLKLDRLGLYRIQTVIGQTIAFVLNNRVIAIPTVKGSLKNRTIILQGQFSLQDASMFTEKIMMSKLPSDFEVIRKWVTPPGFNNTVLVGN